MMDKIPTPVIIGGGALLAFLVMRTTMGSGSTIKTLGTGPVNNDSTDLASIEAKTQGFNTVINDFTSLAIRRADIAGNVQIERTRGENLLSIAELSTNADLQKAKYAADSVRQASSDNLAAQRSTQRGETSRSFISGLFNAGVQLLSHLF